ncbi:MAG: hypothetical protein V1790_17700 [Planctomycetota bacterium]
MMGEYAIRKSDQTEIKIGTCESMYYLRYEDRANVEPLTGNVDPLRDAERLRFRLPFPDEDGVPPGQYTPYNRGVRLTRKRGEGQREYWEDFADETTVENPGIVQLHHESGLLLNVPCYHGHKLPDVTDSMKAFWNGKSHSLELSQLRPVGVNGDTQVWPIVRCRHCGQAWRYQWADVWDYIPDDLRKRLAVYAGLNEATA